MPAFVALFRAINLGSHNKVKMDALKALHEAISLRKVAAYLQTGNIVFESDASDPSQLAGQIAKEFEAKLGFKTEVIVRSLADLKEIVRQNPFLNQPERETKWIVVMFLAGRPESQAKQALFEAYSGPEELFITDQDLFIYYHEGIGRSKLSNVFIERKLKVQGTGRNWNTVAKLLEMTESLSSNDQA